MSAFITFSTLRRPRTPNTYLLAPDGVCRSATPDGTGPEFAASARDVFKQVRAIVAEEPRWSGLEANPSGLQLKFVARSPLLGFRDDIDIQVFPNNSARDPGKPGARLAIYSRSRIGYSDMGANKKRVDALMDRVIAK